MLRNFATIGFAFLSIGQLSAENIPTPNTFSQTSIKQALSQYLNERATWGTIPVKSRSDTASTSAPATLEAYLARRDAWNRPAATADAAPDTAGALTRYLADRDSWGTAPGEAGFDTASADAPVILEAYLARRDAWNRSAATADAVLDTAGALTRYLANRDSWGAAPGKAGSDPASADAPVTLAAYLARRDTWNRSAAAADPAPDTKGALTRYLANRDSWGTAPAVVYHANPRDNDTSMALKALLDARAALGTQDRRQENGDPRTRVAAAAFRNGRDGSPACIEEVREIIGSGVIQFSLGSAKLTTQSRRHLKRLADVTRGCPDIRIRVEGHTDSAGNAASNQRLSEVRAASVAGYLASTGMEEGALEAIGFGQSRPLVSNATSALRAQNRRIELTVLTN